MKKKISKYFTDDDRDEALNLYEKYMLSKEKDIPMFGKNFYTPNIWSWFEKNLCNKDFKVETNGFFEDAERRMISFNNIYENPFPMKLIKIQNTSKFSNLTHRDFLGGILSLGIERNKIGDLLVDKNICYVPVYKEIENFIINNIDKISRVVCSAEVIETFELLPKINFKEEIILVSSLRIDGAGAVNEPGLVPLRDAIKVLNGFGRTLESSSAQAAPQLYRGKRDRSAAPLLALWTRLFPHARGRSFHNATVTGGKPASEGPLAWDINKNSTSANLSFNYQNSDAIGQSIVVEYPLLQLDGVNNQLQLPTAGTKIIFDSDTNLYRSNGLLKTDNNFIVGTLTAGTAVTTSASTNQLLSSVTTGIELGYLSGTTSIIQTQLNSKVNKAGDTMTGPLQLIAGTPSSPSLVFTGSPTTGISASGGGLSISVDGAECMKISSSGIISIDQFTVTGVVHNDSFGNLSSSLITNTDISNSAGITDSKLSTISTAGKVANSATTATNLGTPSSIVERDGSGNFIAGTITSNLTGTVTGASSLNVLKAGDTMGGPLIMPAGSASAPTISFSGSTSTGISAGVLNTYHSIQMEQSK